MTDSVPASRFADVVFRAHNPRWAYVPTSGEGAARHGGRFNRPGVPALYASLDPTTAWMEAQQGMPFKAQPLTLIGYRLDCERIIDLTAPVVLAALDVTPTQLACPWEDLKSRRLEPPSWEVSDHLMAAAWQGAIVPSFAPGCGPDSRNLVLWDWADEPPCRIQVIDSFGRLPKNGSSWV